ncbi:MAG TPA: hypothetical protein VHR66_24035 [Gemmataceae bacterium]|nr:hypothetical protein [Gemmataceae bacterium]
MPHERIAQVTQAFEIVRQLLWTNVRDEHPDWSEKQVQPEVVRIITSGAVPYDVRPALDENGSLILVAKTIEPEAPVEPPRRQILSMKPEEFIEHLTVYGSASSSCN